MFRDLGPLKTLHGEWKPSKKRSKILSCNNLTSKKKSEKLKVLDFFSDFSFKKLIYLWSLGGGLASPVSPLFEPEAEAVAPPEMI